jgi:hypothetical protein
MAWTLGTTEAMLDLEETEEAIDEGKSESPETVPLV